jgi:hypothetical protein
MKALCVFIIAMMSCTPVIAEGFSFGGAGQDFAYPNEPQYQYPYSENRGRNVNRCSHGQAPYQGKCRKIRWLPGSPQQTKPGRSRPHL